MAHFGVPSQGRWNQEWGIKSGAGQQSGEVRAGAADSSSHPGRNVGVEASFFSDIGTDCRSWNPPFPPFTSEIDVEPSLASPSSPSAYVDWRSSFLTGNAAPVTPTFSAPRPVS